MLSEASVQSKTTSSFAQKANSRSKSDNYIFDKLFPIFDQYCESTSMNPVIVAVLCFFVSYQMICTCFWGGRYVNAPILYTIAYFFINNFLFEFIIYTLFVLIILVLGIYQVANFAKTRHASQFILYTISFLAEYLSMVMFHPLCVLIGRFAFSFFNGDNNPVNIVLFALCSIYLVLIFIFYFVTTMLRQNSAFLDSSPLSTLDHTLIPLTLISSSICQMAVIILQTFPKWTIAFIVIIHFGAFLILYGKIWYYPFLDKSINIGASVVLTVCLGLDILCIISLIQKFDFPDFFILYMLIALFVFSAAITYIIYICRQKSLKKKLTECDNEHNFLVLNISNSKRAIYVLHYSIEFMSECFRDFTICKYIMENYQDNLKTVSKLLKILIVFPDKSRELKCLFDALFSKRNVTVSDRFLLFQVLRVSALRQTSSSIAASANLARLKQFSKQCEELIISFWKSHEINTKNLYDYSIQVKKVRALYVENLNMYPNNIAFHEEYSHFLLECATDFKASILEIHKAAMIETGRSYSVDNCFRSFVGMFPFYLKKKIIDLKGHFIQAKRKGNGSQNSSAGAISSTESSSLDAKVEEDIGKINILQAKIRLALQSLTDTKKPDLYSVALFVILFNMFFTLALFIASYIIFINFFDDRYDDTTRSIQLNTCRTELSNIYMFNVLKWAVEIPDPRYIRRLFPFPDEDIIDSTSIIRGYTYPQLAFIHNNYARQSYNNFLFDIVAGAKSGENVYSLVPRMFNDMVNLTYCNGGQSMAPPTKTDFMSALTYHYYITKLLGSIPSTDDWFSSNRLFCNMIVNRNSYADTFKIVRANLVDGQINIANGQEKILIIVIIVMPLVLFILNFVPILLVIIFFSKEINTFAKYMLISDKKFKHDAQNKLAKKAKDIELDIPEVKTSKDNKYVIFAVVFCFIDLALAAISILTINNSIDMNDKFKNVASWSFKSSVRVPNAFDVITSVFMAVMMSGPRKMVAQFSTPADEIQFASVQMQIIEEFRDDLLFGDGDFPPILGFDEDIDDLLLNEKCQPNTSSGDLHDYYVCGSANQLLTFFKNMYTEITATIDTHNSSLSNYQCANMLHILCFHIQPLLDSVNKRIDILVQNFLKSYISKQSIFFAVGIIFIVIRTGLTFFMLSILLQTYHGALMMLKRLSPIGIFANTDLFDYLLNKKTEKMSTDHSISKNIINSTSTSIMCLGNTGIIEIVNPAIQSTFGYTPEQLLGQSFTVIFEDDSIKNQLDLMMSGQSSLSYEAHVNCITDSEESVACSLILIGITDEHETVNSFVTLIRDEHELMMRMEEAEAAKKKSEDLLYQILPRDIVNRLNQGEKDISFQVPSATICFIDVVKFSEYTVNLAPEEIMGNLSIMFAGFDDALSKYETLTKIKLIGDVYMCAAGLFNSEIDPKVHADEMIRFALDALVSLDETCNKLNAVLNVRIGINTGGPLIAGVLGSDKPVFDIIGDPINIAARLQSTDVAGSIQISQDTFELIRGMNFTVECRGEVFLKGKGKSLAYLVRPAQLFSMSRQSSMNNTALATEPFMPGNDEK